jgi:hypothetical protein
VFTSEYRKVTSKYRKEAVMLAIDTSHAAARWPGGSASVLGI